MERILFRIAEAPVSASAKKRAFELIIRILNNITQAANRDDPDLGKYKWIKAQSGSALREKVINVSPLFRELLEALGFTFRVGRPPHVRTGAPQEYIVFPDDASLAELASNAQILEAVIQSIAEADISPEEPQPQKASPPSASNVSASNPSEPDQTTACSISTGPTPSPTVAARRPGRDAELEELRREQQERYRQRAAGGGSTAPPQTERTDETPGSGSDEPSGGWFWKKMGWGGNNGNDNSNSQGQSTSSRRLPRSNRMMTLRDLPKPQRRG